MSFRAERSTRMSNSKPLRPPRRSAGRKATGSEIVPDLTTADKIHGFVNKLLYLPNWVGRQSMSASQPLRAERAGSAQIDLAHYWRDGYAVVRGFFEADEIAQIVGATEQLEAEGIDHGRSFRHGNLFYNV